MAAKSVTFCNQLISETFTVPRINRRPCISISRRRRKKRNQEALDAWQVLMNRDVSDAVIDINGRNRSFRALFHHFLETALDISIDSNEDFALRLDELHLSHEDEGVDPIMPNDSDLRNLLTSIRRNDGFINDFFRESAVSQSSFSVTTSSISSLADQLSSSAESKGNGDNVLNNDHIELLSATDSTSNGTENGDEASDDEKPTKRAKTNNDAKEEANDNGDDADDNDNGNVTTTAESSTGNSKE